MENNKFEKPLGVMNENELKKSIQEGLINIKNILNQLKPLDFLICLHVHKSIKHLENSESVVRGDVIPFENKMIDLTQSILVTRSPSAKNNRIDEDDVKNYLNELSRVFTAASIYIHTTNNDELIKYSQSNGMNVSGTLYPCFEKNHFTDLFSPYSSLLEKIYGIESSELVNGILKISNNLRSMKFLEFLSIENSVTSYYNLEITTNLKDYFNIEKITGWPLLLIQDLSLTLGEWPKFYEDAIQVMLKEAPIKYKPFINIEESYYCFSIDNLIDNIYRTVLRSIRKRDNSTSSIINNIQKELSEALPFKFLKSILPESDIYQSIYYKAPVGANNKNEWCECDGIILYDDVMIIVEVKGGSLSPVSPFSDKEAYKKSLNDLASNPYKQSLRLFNEYNRSGKIKIYKKEGKKSYEFIKEINDIKFIQACCVTLDDFNELAAQIEKTEFIEKSNLPIWCVSINDLRVYPELFDSSSIFLNYLYQRSHAVRNPYIKANDELDHVGMYFAYNDYSTRVKEWVEESSINIEEVYIESHRDEIDIYMSRKVNSSVQNGLTEDILDEIIGPLKKPKQNMNIVFEHVIKLLDGTRDKLNIRVARYLLLLDSESRDNLCEFLVTRSQKILEFKNRPAFLNTYVAYNYEEKNRISELPVIMVFLTYGNNKLFKDIVERKRFLMERVINESDTTYCVIIRMNKDRKLTKILTHIIYPKDFEILTESGYKSISNTRKNLTSIRQITEYE